MALAVELTEIMGVDGRHFYFARIDLGFGYSLCVVFAD
jgi:hypothetical protein